MSVTYKDYYHILGLERDADERAIKAAFRRQARRYHPDVNAGDARAGQLFKDVHEAYQTLSDPVRRRHYDAAYAITAERAAPIAANGPPTPTYGATVPTRHAARLGVLRRFWQEERAALAYATRRARLLRTRLGYGAGVAVVAVALLIGVLIQQRLNPSRPWLANVLRIPAPIVVPHPRHDPPRHPQAPARPTPVYLLGGCLRHCPPATSGQSGRAPASSTSRGRPSISRGRPSISRGRPSASPRPLYLYGGCIRHCPPARRPTQGPNEVR